MTVWKAYPLRHGLLILTKGAITDFTGGAIVNAANRGCLGGAGADGAISRAGGPRLEIARRELPSSDGIRCPTGEAVVTLGGQLRAEHCIHAVGPDYGEELRNGKTPEQCDELLRSAYRTALACAESRAVRTIAFSLLSAGTFRGPRSLESVLLTGVQSIAGHTYEGLRETHLVAFTDGELTALERCCEEWFHGQLNPASGTDDNSANGNAIGSPTDDSTGLTQELEMMQVDSIGELCARTSPGSEPPPVRMIS